MLAAVRSRRMVALLVAAILAVAMAVFISTPQSAGAQPMNYKHLNKIQKRLVSGALEQALAPKATGESSGKVAPLAAPNCGTGTGGDEGDEADNECAPARYQPLASLTPMAGGNYFPTTSTGDCSQTIGNNVKTNTDCENISDAQLAGRGQAQNETSIAIDPMNSKRMIASQNDYRRGDGNCYGEYSSDAGQTWHSTTIPMSFAYPINDKYARQYWDAGGDTSVAFDTKGNAYFSCQVFNRGNPASQNADQSSAFYVFRSTNNGGASWNFPGRAVATYDDTAGLGNALLDKQLMTVDNHVGSPFQDRVYVSWTNFAPDGTAYIYEAFSSDYGESFSAPVLVSGTTPLCTNTYAPIPTPNGNCNENQFSQPFTGPDGALYVTWANFNNTTFGDGDNRNSMLLAKSTDGGKTFSAPVKVSDYYDLPDCATYQNGADAGRACVPEKADTNNSIFRATNYPVGAVNPTNSKQVIVTFGSYINPNSREANGCFPRGFSSHTGINLYDGVKTPGACNNDILISVSNDAGQTFTGSTAGPRVGKPVNGDYNVAQRHSDEFWQWAAFTTDGKLAVSYYDRAYTPDGQSGDRTLTGDEKSGYSDISISTSQDLNRWIAQRVTSGSMPPPTQFSALFFGDYSGLAASTVAFPHWMDTRDPELFYCGANPDTGKLQVCGGYYTNNLLANDQNTFTAQMNVPVR